MRAVMGPGPGAYHDERGLTADRATRFTPAMEGIGWRGIGIAAALLALHGSAARAVPSPGDVAARSLARFHDPVVVTTAVLAALPDRSTVRLRLYRMQDGALRPTVYQFDRRDPNGDVALSDTDFVADDDDELVFMADDTGDRATLDDLPPGATAALELEVMDPRDRARGWVYVVHFDDPPPLAPREPYVSIDPNGLRVRSAFYEAQYADGYNFFTALRVLSGGGGTGQNLVQRTSMRGEPTLRLLLADLQLRFDERSTHVQVDGTRSGPVRAIRRVRLAIDLGPFPELPNGTAQTFHYRTTFDTPSRISVPWLVLKALRGFRFENLVVFDPRVLPLRYWDGANPQGVDLAGRGEPPIEAARDHDWWVVSGAAGSLLQTLEVPDDWTGWGIARGTVLQQGGADAEGVAHAPDRWAAGYSLLNMTELRRHGSYELRQRMVVLPAGCRPGEEVEPLAMVRAPLQVGIRALRP